MKSLASIDGTWALKKFPERLRMARNDRGWEQKDLTFYTGLQPSAISHFECGRRLPSALNIIRLAIALRVTTDYLMGISEVGVR